MADFDALFIESKGKPIEYGGYKLYRIDRFPIKNEETLICSIEKAIKKDKITQGFCIDVTGYVEIRGEIIKKGKGIRVHFWADDPVQITHIKIFTKIDSVIIYNVCEFDASYLASDAQGHPIEKRIKPVNYWMGGAAMIIEEIESGRRYRCSDTDSAEKSIPFNDIVFTVQRRKE